MPTSDQIPSFAPLGNCGNNQSTAPKPPLTPKYVAILRRIADGGGSIPGHCLTVPQRKLAGRLVRIHQAVRWTPPPGDWDYQRTSLADWTIHLTEEGVAELGRADG